MFKGTTAVGSEPLQPRLSFIDVQSSLKLLHSSHVLNAAKSHQSRFNLNAPCKLNLKLLKIIEALFQALPVLTLLPYCIPVVFPFFPPRNKFLKESLRSMFNNQKCFVYGNLLFGHISHIWMYSHDFLLLKCFLHCLLQSIFATSISYCDFCQSRTWPQGRPDLFKVRAGWKTQVLSLSLFYG